MQETRAVYQTNNLALAVTLTTCGVPFFETPDGKPAPVVNFYERVRLEKLGYKGWKLEEAAEDAYKRGKAGTVVYAFQAVEFASEIVNAFDSQKLAAKEAEKESGGAPTQGVCQINIDPETAGRFAFQLLQNRKVLIEEWKKPVPLLLLPGKSRKSRGPQGESITIGSSKIVSLGAGAKTRKRVGIA